MEDTNYGTRANSSISSTPTIKSVDESYVWMLMAMDGVSKWFPIVTTIIGLPGNVMSLLITTKKDNRSRSTCIYMAGLAIVDTIVLLNNLQYKIFVIHGVLGAGSMDANVFYLR